MYKQQLNTFKDNFVVVYDRYCKLSTDWMFITLTRWKVRFQNDADLTKVKVDNVWFRRMRNEECETKWNDCNPWPNHPAILLVYAPSNVILTPETSLLTAMDAINERSAYPHPDEFKVMRPEYLEEEEEENGLSHASITIAPFKVDGVSSSRPGARRAALYKAEQVYRSYHPSYAIKSPFPDSFVDQNGSTWRRLSEMQRHLGDYEFTDEDGSDYTDIETMLLWDIRVKS